MQNNSDMIRTHTPFTRLRPSPLDQCFNRSWKPKTGSFIAIFEILYLPALPIIVSCYWFLFVYVCHIIAFDL